MYKQPTDKAAAIEAINFFDWAYRLGDKMADELDYVPLSPAEKAKTAEAWKTIR